MPHASLRSMLWPSPTACLNLRHSLSCSSFPPIAHPTYAAHSSLLASLSRLSRGPPSPHSSLQSCTAPPAPSRSAHHPPSQAKAGASSARAPPLVLVLVVLAHCRSPRDSTQTTRIDRPRPCPPLHCKCMF
jgi:hypothetical protein